MVHRYLTMTFPCKKNTIYGTPPSWNQWTLQVPVVALTSWWTIKKLVLTALHRYLDLSTPAGQLLQIENNISREHFFGVKLCGSCGKTCQNPSSCAISAGKNTFLSAKWACFSWSNPTILWQNPTILPMAAWATPPMTYCSKEIPGDLA